MPDVIATPAPAPKIVESPPRQAQAGVAPPSSGEIKVVPGPVEPAAPPKPGTARARMAEALAKRGKPAFGQSAPRTEPPPAPNPATAKPAAVTQPKTTQTQPQGEAPVQPARSTQKPDAVDTQDTQQTSPVGDSDEAEPSEDEITAKAAEKGKNNPWKLLKAEQAKRKAVEREREEVRKLIADEPARKAEVERLAKAEQRAKELEDHIRFVDYEKSAEFAEKHHKPYEAAWERGMSELQGVEVVNPQTGEARPFSAQDMLQLLNMPLTKARELANEMFGDMADDVMAQRKEIRTMFDQRARALDDARKNGSEREKARMAEAERTQSKVNEEVSKTWRMLNEESLKDPSNAQYFTPKEGDDEWNSRLEKGYELVDKAFGVNPMDPRLTSDERKEAIRKHVAIRNRAAAYGALKARDAANAQRIAELEAELAEYRGTTPETGGSEEQGEAPVVGSKARQRVFGALHKLAKTR